MENISGYLLLDIFVYIETIDLCRLKRVNQGWKAAAEKILETRKKQYQNTLNHTIADWLTWHEKTAFRVFLQRNDSGILTITLEEIAIMYKSKREYNDCAVEHIRDALTDNPMKKLLATIAAKYIIKDVINIRALYM